MYIACHESYEHCIVGCLRQNRREGWQQSASSSSLVVRRTRLSTIGDRACPVAASRLWNERSAAERHVGADSDCFPGNV